MDNEFNTIGECACCGMLKDNCYENIKIQDGYQKVELVCKECYNNKFISV